MPENEHLPTLIQLLYCEKAGLVARHASSRLKRWCAAFEACQESITESRRRHSVYAWKGLLCSCQQAPWEVTREEVLRI